MWARRQSGKVEVEALRVLSLMAGIDADHVGALADAATSWRLYGQGQLIYWPGAESPGIFVLLGGTLRAYGLNPSDVEVDLLHLSHGEALDFEALPGRLADVAYLVAGEGEAVVTRIPADLFRSTLSQCSASSAVLAAGVRAQLFQLATLGVELALFDPTSRVRHFLADEAEKNPDHMVWESHAEIARRVAARRESVTRALKPIKKQGLIDYHPHHHGIRVLQVDQLKG